MKMQSFFKLCLIFVMAAGPAAGHGKVREEAKEKVTVYAAASTTNAVTDVARLFEDQTGTKAVLSFASSSTLAKQIEAGAPAEVYLSADREWMNYLDERGLIEPGSRHDLLGNRLCLIAPADSGIGEVTIGPGFALAKLLGNGYLAMGDPDHVPAGKANASDDAKRVLEFLQTPEAAAVFVKYGFSVR